MSNVKVKRFVFTGPESTGKTTLSRASAKKYGGLWVPEAARSIIDELPGPYQYSDLLDIAREQWKIQTQATTSKESPVFQDTDLLTIRIWALYKYETCAEWITERIQNHLPELYFLCGTDWPWIWDPQRENPNNRRELHDIYLQELNNLPVNYVKLKGTFEERMIEIDKYI